MQSFVALEYLMRFDGVVYIFHLPCAFGPSARAHPALPSEDVRPVNEFS